MMKNLNLLENLRTSLPQSLLVVEPKIDWSAVESEFPELVGPMAATQQQKDWHGEGDVWTHTRLVVEALIRSPEWQSLPEFNRLRLFLAALLHDVGKPGVSRVEDGKIVSPKHAVVGARSARVFLWNRLGLHTEPEQIRFREEICALIRRHPLPYRLLEKADPQREVLECAMLLKNRELGILSEADMRGRISDSKEDSIERVRIFLDYVAETGVMDSPYPFASPHSAFGYFSRKLQYPTDVLFDDTWGEVVIMSGLPASGKDSYIREHYADRPMVSLDAWRQRLSIGWQEDQTPVVLAAKQEAREFLRQKVPFVWNATHLRPDFRSQSIQMCVEYGARIHIVWCEAALPELLRRNAQRAESVLPSAIPILQERMEPPTILEGDSFQIVGDV